MVKLGQLGHERGETPSSEWLAFTPHVGMPFVEGESLRERIDREKQLGVDDAVAISQKVARERLTPRQGDQLSATEADHDACRDPNLVTVHSTQSFIGGKVSAPVALHPRGQLT